MAVCPMCAAVWYRDHKGTVLLDARKPAKRAAAGLLAIRLDGQVI